MYIAKKNRREGDKVFVDFTDGVTTREESCIPQNLDGLKYWVKSRLDFFNSLESVDITFTDGTEIDVTNPVVVPPVLTQSEIDRNTWLEKYRKWLRIKTTVVDTGIVPLTNTKVKAFIDDLKNTLKPEYIDFI